MSYPVSNQCLGISRGRCVRERNSIQPSGEVVNYSEKMGVTSRLQGRPYQINIDVVKMMLRDMGSLKWCFDMSLDL